MTDILTSQVDLVDGLDRMDIQLRRELGIKSKRDGSLISPEIIGTPKQKFKNMGTQLMCLIVVIGVVVGAILVHRKQQEAELSRQQDKPDVKDQSVPLVSKNIASYGIHEFTETASLVPK